MAAVLTSAISGAVVGKPEVTLDTARRQIEVRVSHADWAPKRNVVRLAAGVGLWDAPNKAYLVPQGIRSTTVPGGGKTAAEAFFNVAFRSHEPLTAPVADFRTQPAFWRERQQGQVLATGDLSPFAASVDFGKLVDRVTDDTGVPRTGHFDRILASHFERAQGVDYYSSCFKGDFRCQYQGQLQPYAVYVPRAAPPKTGYGMTLLLHGNASNYNEFLGSRNAEQFGNRSSGSIIISPEARDPGSSFTGYGAADVFEAWADVARFYHLDPTWNAISGYSLGGLGTYKPVEQFPDLFGKAVAIVGSPGGPPGVPQTQELKSFRNVPIMEWDVAPVDGLNQYAAANILALQRLGDRYEFLQFPGEHLTPSFNDNYAEAVPFLADTRLQASPQHVSYVYVPDGLDSLSRQYGDYPALSLVAGRAGH